MAFVASYLWTCFSSLYIQNLEAVWAYGPDIRFFMFFFLQFLGLASNILNFITSSMLNSRNNFIRNYLSVSLSEHHMATLASIIKEVDKDGLKGQ